MGIREPLPFFISRCREETRVEGARIEKEWLHESKERKRGRNASMEKPDVSQLRYWIRMRSENKEAERGGGWTAEKTVARSSKHSMIAKQDWYLKTINS